MSSPNPDYEYYRRQILSRRRYHPLYSLLLLISGTMGMLGFLSNAPLNGRMLALLGSTTAQIVHITLFVISLAAFLAGLLMLWRCSRPPTQHQIENFRQKQRRRLFSEAQGQQPWWNLLIVRIVIALTGLVFALGGILTIAYFGTMAWDGWIYLIVSGILLTLVGYIIPRERRKLPSYSAERLASHLISGEATSGEDDQNERVQ